MFQSGKEQLIGQKSNLQEKTLQLQELLFLIIYSNNYFLTNYLFSTVFQQIHNLQIIGEE